MRIQGTAGRMRQIVDDLSNRSMREKVPQQSGIGNRSSDVLVNKKARDDFYQKESRIRMHRLKQEMKQHLLFCVTIGVIFLVIFFMMLYRYFLLD